MRLRFRRIDESYYSVSWGTVTLGEVYRDESAWSYANWFISGERRERASGGVNGTTLRHYGYQTREVAARHLAVMQSSLIVSAL